MQFFSRRPRFTDKILKSMGHGIPGSIGTLSSQHMQQAMNFYPESNYPGSQNVTISHQNMLPSHGKQ